MFFRPMLSWVWLIVKPKFFGDVFIKPILFGLEFLTYIVYEEY